MYVYPFGLIWGIRLPAVIVGYLLFERFRLAHIKDSFLIRVFSEATFGIYLFHAGALLPIIEDLLGINSATYLSYIWIPVLLGSTILIFLTGGLVDIIRKKTIERWGACIYTKWVYYVDKKMRRKEIK